MASFPETGRSIGAGWGLIMVLRSAARVVVIAVGSFIVGLIGVMVGISWVNVTLAIGLRTVLVLAVVLVMTRAFRISDRRADDHGVRPRQQVLIAAGLAYVVNISTWGGHTLFGQLLVPVGVFSAALDVVVWMAVAVAGVHLADRARVESTAAPIPYG
jgi:hypothetical protein